MARRLEFGARLVLASHNPGKVAELSELLRPHDVAVISAGTLGLPEPAEDAPDFVGNARIKALAAARASELPALADDSGFCVAALYGAPGFYSARWAGPARTLPQQWIGYTATWVTQSIVGPGSSRRCAWPGPMTTPKPSWAGWMVSQSGRHGAPTASAMTPCSCLPARRRRSAN